MDEDSSQTFNLTPDEGFHVANVVVDGVGLGALPSYTFTRVTTNHAISASFAQDPYTVNASVVGGNGTLDPASQNVAPGGTASIDLIPGPGYHASFIINNQNTFSHSMSLPKCLVLKSNCFKFKLIYSISSLIR